MLVYLGEPFTYLTLLILVSLNFSYIFNSLSNIYTLQTRKVNTSDYIKPIYL